MIEKMFAKSYYGHTSMEKIFQTLPKNHPPGCKEKILTKILSKAIITFVALG
jgi:hypothetical protein